MTELFPDGYTAVYPLWSEPRVGLIMCTRCGALVYDLEKHTA